MGPFPIANQYFERLLYEIYHEQLYMEDVIKTDTIEFNSQLVSNNNVCVCVCVCLTQDRCVWDWFISLIAYQVLMGYLKQKCDVSVKF